MGPVAGVGPADQPGLPPVDLLGEPEEGELVVEGVGVVGQPRALQQLQQQPLGQVGGLVASRVPACIR